MGENGGTGEIISLKRHRAGPEDGAIGLVEAYWDQLRTGRLAPSRAEFDPRGISPVLDRAFVLEKIAPGLGRFRVAGRRLTELMGMELSGMPLTACFLPEARDRLTELMVEVLETPARVRLACRAPGGIGRRQLDAEMLLLPLRDDLGGMTRVLGVVAVPSQTGRAPRRFDIIGEEITPILRSPVAAPAKEAVRPRERQSKTAPEGAAANNVIRFPGPVT